MVEFRSKRTLRYTYEVNGRTFDGSTTVDSDIYDATPVGAPFGVTYLANDPAVHEPGAVKPEDGEEAEIRLVGFALLLGAVFVAGVVYTEYTIRRQKWLCMFGTATVGTVTAQTGGKNRKTHYVYTPAGDLPRQAKAQASSATVRLPVGVPLTIQYAPKSPGKSFPYGAMGMARIVKESGGPGGA